MFDSLFPGILVNHTLVTAVLTWIMAQLIKFLSCLIIRHEVDFTRLTGAGGMPSAHAAMVSAMAASIGKRTGWASGEFGIAVVLALVVMYDAAGIRQAVGKQARVLNTLVNEMPGKRMDIPEGLKELLGHTPVEVIAGALLGLVLAFIL
ncbi:MAG: divergent PAP2 family protein [Bacillota bacterium]